MGKSKQTSDVIDAVLLSLATAGMVGVAIVAPNSTTALERPLSKFFKKHKAEKDTRRISRYLHQQNLVKIVDNHDGSYQITLTKKGQSRTNRVRFESLKIPEEEWDQKWRLFMFDIPEQHKSIRDYISRHMRQLGFKQLQKSVFVYPYPVDEFVELVRLLFPEVEKHISYMVVDETDQHNELVKQFKSIL